jgi:hypothetical protein
MTLNWIGLDRSCSNFFGRLDRSCVCAQDRIRSPTIWVPSGVSLLIGLLLELGALRSEDPRLSAALGIFGITVLWDALEFWRQHHRVRKGHAPANPNNPAARLLQSSSAATTIDWLDRNPIGRPLTTDELQRIEEGAQ